MVTMLLPGIGAGRWEEEETQSLSALLHCLNLPPCAYYLQKSNNKNTPCFTKNIKAKTQAFLASTAWKPPQTLDLLLPQWGETCCHDTLGGHCPLGWAQHSAVFAPACQPMQGQGWCESIMNSSA